MKKTIIVWLSIFTSFLCYYCNSNSSTTSALAKADSASIPEPACNGDDLFPIKPPSNAEPEAGNECQFYRWAWGTFLYVTDADPVTKKPRFLTFETPSALFGKQATPLFNAKAGDTMLLLAPRIAEDSVVESISDVLQAVTKGIIVDRDGRTVYYAQHVNDTFANFIRSNGYTDMNKLLAADTNQTFPRGSLELKSSWKIVVPGDDVSNYYTTKARVAEFVIQLENGKPTVVIDPSKTCVATVALLGIHVVGVAQNHPEFIWATFEHDSIAPDNKRTNGTIDSARPVDPVLTNKYLLYHPGDPGQNCNILNPLSNLVFANQAQQTFKNPSSIFHLYSFNEDEDIKPLNASVKAKLRSVSSIWKDYSFKGAVWLNRRSQFLVGHDFSQDDKSDTNTIGGEKQLSNVTMETFRQATQRCFSCHKTADEFHTTADGISLTFPGKRLSVSHVLTNAYFNSQEMALRNSKKKNK